MKNPQKVAALLAELKAECEYSFEFAAVAGVEKFCLELPRVKILDESHQEFLGKVYEKDATGRYKNLHRVVWKFFNGEIPKGCEIHHRDFNPEKNQLDNQLENLQLVTEKQHRQIHVPKGWQIPKPLKKFVCEWCGKEYETLDNGRNHFCSPKCSNAAHYNEKVEKTCPVCGKTFLTRKHNGARTCSSLCAARIKKPTEVTSVCVGCGKEFTASRKAKWCSQECYQKFAYERSKVKRTCAYCGKEFLAAKPETKCCSRECAHALRGNGSKVEHTCPVCGKKFFTQKDYHRGRFCSFRCQEKHNKETKLITRSCVICGKTFQCSTRNPKLTCSRSCASKLNHQTRQLNNVSR